MRLLPIFTFFYFLATSAFAGFIEGSRIIYGNWEGGAYFDDQTGLFSHCAVSARYVTGNTLYFSLTREYSFNIGVTTTDPIFKGHEQFPTTVKVDRFDAVFPTATVLEDDFAMVRMPNLEVAFDQIKRGRTLWINSQFGQSPFDLTGTYRVLNKTYACARNYYNYQTGKKSGSSNSSPNFDKSILYKLATYNLSDLQIRDFDFLTEEQVKRLMPNLNNDNYVFWEALDGAIIGGVLAAYEPNLKDLKESDAADLAFLSTLCGGDVLTGALTVKSSEIPMRELITQCIDNEKFSKINFTKFKLDDHVIYVGLAASDLQSKIDDTSKASRDLAIKAVSFIQD